MTNKINWTDEQLRFLSDNREMLRKDLTKAFNAKFGTTYHMETIRGLCKRKGYHTGRTGHFKKGEQPWNTGKKGLPVSPKCQATQFKKGQKPPNQKPIGHERICSKDGYILVKTDKTNPYTGFRGWYRAKQLEVWEAANGPIPKGKVIRFKDGNKLNCELDNLELLDQAVNLRMNKHKVNDLPEEVRPAVKTLAKLEVATFDKQKQLKGKPGERSKA